MKRHRCGLWGLLFLSTMACTVAGAQGTAAVVGTVTDSSGAVVPGATVTLTNGGTGIAQTVATSESGDYTFPLAQVGNYSLKVQAQGFKLYTAPSVSLSAGDRLRVDVKMEVGAVSQSVEVSGVAPALQTDSSNVGGLVTSQAVEDLPLNARNVIKLVQLSTGVTEGLPNSKASGTIPDDRRLTSAFSVNGQSDFENNNLVDGMDNNERLLGTIGVRPSIDAIQEVNVSTNLYDSSVGRTAGGVVDVITKSGTNELHGSGFEFLRNKVLNTNPNYNFGSGVAANPQFQQNQYGASVGGPIKRDKTFFFVDYEGFSQAQGLAQTTYTVPTYCERGLIVCPDGKKVFGDFSDLNTITPFGGNATGSCSPATSCPQGLDVPAGSITPLGLAYFDLFPLPECGPGTSVACGSSSGVNGTQANYVSAPTRFVNMKTIDGRIDQHFAGADTLFARYTLNNETTETPDGFPGVTIATTGPNPGSIASAGTSGGVLVHPVAVTYAGKNKEQQQGVALTYTHVFRPTLLAVFKAGYLRSAIQSFPINQGTGVSTALGFPCNANSCVNFNANASGLAGVAVSQTNFGLNPTRLGDSTFIPELEFDNSFIYSGGLTWTKGAQSIRVGLSVIRRDLMFFQNTTAQGTFSFTGIYTGIAYADLLEGLASSQTRSNQLVDLNLRTWEPSAYVQDDWRIRHWLTLNLGARYDIFTPYTEHDGRISNYDPYLGLLVSPAIPGAQQSSKTAMVPTNYGDLAPRVGFAATLPHQFVMRGGFGLSFFPDNYLSQAYMRNAPFNLPETCSAQNKSGTNNACAGTFANGAAVEYGSTNGGSCQINVTCGASAGLGGSALAGGLPIPVLNIATATNTSSYNGLSIVALPVNKKEAYLEQFNLLVQKELRGNVVTVGYVGALGRHTNYAGGVGTISIPQNQDANAFEVSQGPPLTLGGATASFGTLPGFPYLSKTSLTEQSIEGLSSYHGLQTSLVRRFSHGLTVNVNYTWSHTMDNTEGGTTCVDSEFAATAYCWVDISKGATQIVTAANPLTANSCSANASACRPELGWQQYGRGNSTQDTPNRIAWAINYQIPYGNSLTGVAGAFAKGWGANLSGSWQSGLPFTVTESSTGISGVGVAARLDQVGNAKLPNPSIHEWYNPAAFALQATDTLGYQDNAQVFGPRQRRLDISFFKEFGLTERLRMQFRTEIFNLFNTPNFSNPSAVISQFATGSPALGTQTSGVDTITSLNTNENPRQIQFALKLMF